MTYIVKPDKRNINNNPTTTTTYIKSDWSVPPPRPGEYAWWLSQNNIEPLICNDYLPEFKKALTSAEKSIYITVWGFDAALPLVRTPQELIAYNHETILGELLKHKAEGGVKVKILVFYATFKSVVGGVIRTTVPGYRTSNQWLDYISPDAENLSSYRRRWLSTAKEGKINNLEFSTRAAVKYPPYYHEDEQEVESLEPAMRQAKSRQAQWPQRYKIRRAGFGINSDYKHPYELDPDLRNKDAELLREWALISRSYIQGLKDEYQQKGYIWPHDHILSLSSHHQKVIVVDHELPDSETCCGFVQGMNLLPEYFDSVEHPYKGDNRFSEEPYRDIGVKVRGACIPDLFRNFKESWNLHVEKSQITEEPKDGSLYSEQLKGYKLSGQVLRTYPIRRERKIEDWTYMAIAKMNNFLYIEDQYFRHEGFADAIIKEAQKKDGPLYVFVISIPNSGGKTRQRTLEAIGREDLLISEEEAEEKATERLEEVKAKMEAANVKVHVCCLRTSTYVPRQEQWYGKTLLTTSPHNKYKDIYIHSKLLIVDNAHYLIGSANHHVRGMQTDTEVSIAVEDTRANSSVKELRETIWNQYLNLEGYKNWTPQAQPEEWYQDWNKTMNENDQLYWKDKAPISKLFTLFDNSLSWIPID